MQIDRVILWNFGCYKKVDVPFSKGTTAITGKNEAGKTTLFHAIGFALFDYRAGKLAGYLREGASEGMVSVEISFPEGDEYRVIRRFTATSTTRWEIGNPLVFVSGTENVRRWLQERMGIDPELGLKTLFERVVGVPQGTDTAPFQLTPAVRRKVFGSLLKTQEFEKAATGLRPTENAITEEIHVLETTIANAEGRLSVLPSLEEELDTITHAIVEFRDNRTVFYRNAVAEKQDQVTRMDQVLEKAQEARAQAEESKTRADAHFPQVTGAQENAKEAEKAQKIVEATFDAHQSYSRAVAALRKLEQRKEEHDKLLAKQARLREQVAHVKLSQARKVEVEEELKQLRAHETEIEQGRIRYAELKTELADYDSTIEDTQKLLNSVSNSATIDAAEHARLEEQSNRLLAWDTAYCPTCGTGLTPEGKEEILQRNIHDGKLALLRATEGQKRVTDHAQTIERLRERCRMVEDFMAKLPTAAALPRVRKKLADLADTLNTLIDTLDADAVNVADLTRVTVALVEFDGLHAKLSHFRERRNANEESHGLHERKSALALYLPAYQETQKKLQVAQEELEGKAKVLYDVFVLAQSIYDAQGHAEAKKEMLTLQKKLTETETLLEEKQTRHKALVVQLEDLQSVAAYLDLCRTEHANANTDRSVIQRVRRLLREAGPLITQRAVERVSQRTATIYRDLTGTSEGYLRWTQDFGLVLYVEGHERAFSRFSGGQQMSAALAWRLAILQEISRVGIIIVDEPTAHLDPDRREYLATKVGQMQEGVQTLIVSHDPTFERVTTQCIRIVRDEEGSHLE